MQHLRRWRLVALACLAITGSAVPCAGQQLRVSAGLCTMLQYFQLHVVDGRIRLNSQHAGRKFDSKWSDSKRNEQLAIALSGPATTISYNSACPEWALQWDALPGNELLVRRQPKSDNAVPPLFFYQPSEGPLVLDVGAGDARRVVRGATLWHLFLAEPELCGTQLVPLLELMRPDWALTETAQSMEAVLWRSAEAAVSKDRERWMLVINELGSEKYARRRAAYRKLQAAGHEALPYLMAADISRLDAEQRFRIRLLLKNLAGSNQADTPDQVAAWLSNDPQAWYLLLNRPDEAQRRMAAQRLAGLLGQPLLFDASADADTRRLQLEAVRTKHGTQVVPSAGESQQEP